ncbi:MAG: hypothetical protein QUV35_04980 [Hydrogenophaga sp.]|uniref:hypothetical protein n=1 Tax=Hydrogenophaga sp. TaxID=1904254 RepID=UPI00260187DD|nr:hypothetical protein [Hydrogenophaga sp.]MDM7941964.1 hypothetical protein [Hydrogenophaga sp.]
MALNGTHAMPPVSSTPMRHWFLVLMIALLPLRGWVGDAMAMDMLGAPAHNMAALSADSGHPCPDHTVGATTDHAAQDSHGEHSHAACDVCNGPALAMATTPLQVLPPAHSVRARPAEHFASSEARRGVKPPIS